MASKITQFAFNYLDAPPVVVGARNWITPPDEVEDAFFPFSDNVEEIAKGGATAIIQPGGSVRDQDSIEAADRLGLAMVFTGVRHFRH